MPNEEIKDSKTEKQNFRDQQLRTAKAVFFHILGSFEWKKKYGEFC